MENFLNFSPLSLATVPHLLDYEPKVVTPPLRQRWRQAKLTEMKPWTALAAAPDEDGSTESSSGPADGTDTRKRKRGCEVDNQRRPQQPTTMRLCPEVLGLVVSFYCECMDDAAQLARVWPGAVVHSASLWARVQPLLDRNPFPVNERLHRDWHFDHRDEAHLRLLVAYSVARLNAGSDGDDRSLVLWTNVGDFPSRVEHDVVIGILGRVQDAVHCVEGGGKKTLRLRTTLREFQQVPLSINARRDREQQPAQFRKFGCSQTSLSLRVECPSENMVNVSTVGLYHPFDFRTAEVEFPWKPFESCTLCLTEDNFEAEEEHVSFLFTTATSLKQLEVQFSEASHPEEWAVVPVASLLRHLRDSPCNITHLSLGLREANSRLHFNIHHLQLGFLTNLQFLRVDMPYVSRTQLAEGTTTSSSSSAVVKLPPNLETLELCGLDSRTTAAFDGLGDIVAAAAEQLGDRLRTLSIEKTWYTLSQHHIDSIARCEALRSLRIENLTTGPLEALLDFSPLVALKHLQEFSLSFESPEDVKTFYDDDMNTPNCWPKLHSLDTTSWTPLDAPFPFAERLTQLTLRCVSLSSDEFTVSLKIFTNLRKLTICASFMPWSVDVDMMEGLLHLEELKLTWEPKRKEDPEFEDECRSSSRLPFLTKLHLFPALTTLILDDERFGMSWHMFGDKHIKKSFRRASEHGRLRRVVIKDCLSCMSHLDNPESDDLLMSGPAHLDHIVTPGYSHAWLADEEALSDYSEVDSDEDDELSFHGARWRSTDSNGHHPFTEVEWGFLKQLDAQFHMIESTADPSSRCMRRIYARRNCLLALREAIVFWRSLYPRTRFSVAEELDDGRSRWH